MTKFSSIEEARVYLLDELASKYGFDFTIVGSESYKTIGTLDVFTCSVSPIHNTDQIANARVTQRGEATDDYALYYFRDKIIESCTEVCASKDYIVDYSISAETPWTSDKWDADTPLDEYLSESGAYGKIEVRLVDLLTEDEYSLLIQDILNDLTRMPCYFEINVVANVKGYSDNPDAIHDVSIFHYQTSAQRPDIPDLESIKSNINDSIILHTVFE